MKKGVIRGTICNTYDVLFPRNPTINKTFREADEATDYLNDVQDSMPECFGWIDSYFATS